MEKTTSEKIRLGIFVILGTVLLIIALYLIGSRQNMFGNTLTINAIFKNVSGLHKANNVRYSGINIGTVKDIEMVNDTTIRVDMLIEKKMQKHIKTNAIATIGSDGLVGSMIVNIVPGEGDAAYVQSGDEIQSYSKIATADMLNTLSMTNDNLALLMKGLLKVTGSLNQGEGSFGRLLNDTIMGNQLRYTLTNLKEASQSAKVAMADINGIVKNIDFDKSVAGVFLSDTISAGNMRNMLANLEKSSIEIEKMTENLNTVVGSIKDGKGAINYLAKDSTLVNQLKSTMRNVEQGVERFNEDMEALKHNFLFRGYFRKLEKEKKKEGKADR
ncbi:MAG: MlaD family protein [Maribacter sp.]|nr:MlaD family protein [Maribacter sp.]